MTGRGLLVFLLGFILLPQSIEAATEVGWLGSAQPWRLCGVFQMFAVVVFSKVFPTESSSHYLLWLHQLLQNPPFPQILSQSLLFACSLLPLQYHPALPASPVCCSGVISCPRPPSWSGYLVNWYAARLLCVLGTIYVELHHIASTRNQQLAIVVQAQHQAAAYNCSSWIPGLQSSPSGMGSQHLKPPTTPSQVLWYGFLF